MFMIDVFMCGTQWSVDEHAVAGSTSCCELGPRAMCLHTHNSVAKQYKLVPSK